jgi:hypothetical protein
MGLILLIGIIWAMFTYLPLWVAGLLVLLVFFN